MGPCARGRRANLPSSQSRRESALRSCCRTSGNIPDSPARAGLPTPRAHLVRFHGLLGPAAKWRPWIVPNNATTEAPLDSPDTATATATSGGADLANCDEMEKPADAAQQRGRNYTWSELMKRVRR